MDSLLILADLDAGEERVLAAMSAASGLELVTCSSVDKAVSWLEIHDPKVVAFKAVDRGAERLCQTVRSRTMLAGVPLIGLVSDTSDSFVEKFYSLGADDVMLEKFGPGFVTRLKTLPDKMALPPKRGLAVVGDADRDRSNVVGRVLANAGYEVKSAHDAIALDYYVQQHQPRLVVSSVELGSARKLITDARKRGYIGPWIATARRRDFHRYAEALAGLERVSVVAATSAPEIVLFAANELLRGESPPARSEERHLFGTTVLFRAPGEELDELGFSYNISARGLFVRTLAPVERETVWVELRPPRSRHRVRLEGRVAWRRAYVPTAAATGPPGFGIELTGGLSGSLELWREQVQTFVTSALAGAMAMTKRHASRIADSRTSGEYMLLEVPSESRLAVVKALGEGTSTPPPPGPRPKSIPPPLPPQPPVLIDTDLDPEAERVSVSELLPDSELDSEHERVSVSELLPGSTPMAAPPPEELSEADLMGEIERVSVSDLEPESAKPAPEDEKREEEEKRDESADADEDDDADEEDDDGADAEEDDDADEEEDDDADEEEDDDADEEEDVRRVTRDADSTAPASVGGARPPSKVPVSSILLGLAAGAAVAVVYYSTHSKSSATAEAPSGAPDTPALSTAEPVESAPAEPPASAAVAPSNSAALPDPAALAPTQGYLIVRSSTPADVYATGFKIGVTNQPSVSSCGLRWVRLSEGGTPPRWVSPGQTVEVKCQAITTIEIAPGP